MTVAPSKLVSIVLALTVALANLCACGDMAAASTVAAPAAADDEHACCTSQDRDPAPAAPAEPSDDPCEHCNAADGDPKAVERHDAPTLSPQLTALKPAIVDLLPAGLFGTASRSWSAVDPAPRLSDLVHASCQLTL